MAIKVQRRHFLLSSALLGLSVKSDAIAFSPVQDNTGSVKISTAKSQTYNVAYIAASKSPLGESSLVCLDHQMMVIAEHDIDARGHSFARSNAGHIAAIARRPSDFCLVLNSLGEKIVEFQAQENRHFYGHGVYSACGHYLYLTENDYAYSGTRGVIGVYDAQDNYRRINELSTFGVGPHEIALSGDGEQLIIANGGIETHPQTGRKKLNLKIMQPSLVHIDRDTGALIHQSSLEAEYRGNSIRHIAQASDGRVYLGLQKQAGHSESPLVAFFSPESKTLKTLPLTTKIQSKLNDYVGDICLDSSGKYLAVSSPKGDALVLINLKQNNAQLVHINGVCGLASVTGYENQFIASTGEGKLWLIDVNNRSVTHTLIVDSLGSKRWDNHILSIS